MTGFQHMNARFPQRRDVLRLLSATALGAAALPAFAQGAAKLPRLVTVSGAITEVVYLLGAEAQLVGTDTTSLYPAAAQATPKVGYMRQLSAEGLLSLKPDAIIATNESGPTVVLDQIRSAGVKVEIIEADHSWGEVQRKVQAVCRRSSTPSGARCSSALPAPRGASRACCSCCRTVPARRSRARRPPRIR